MNTKAQTGIISLLGFLLVFILVWAFWAGAWLREQGELAIQNQGLTGIEAFLLANLNLWVLVFLILGVMAFMFFGGRR